MIAAMVLYAVCVVVALQSYSRGVAAMWNAHVTQEATAVAAWHSAQAQQQGCPAGPQQVTALAGRDVLPHDGFDVTCDDSTTMPWPPALTQSTTAGTDTVAALTVTVGWNNYSHTPRSYQQVLLQSPGP